MRDLDYFNLEKDHLRVLWNNYKSVLDTLDDIEESLNKYLKNLPRDPLPMKAVPKKIDRRKNISQRFELASQTLEFLITLATIKDSNPVPGTANPEKED